MAKIRVHELAARIGRQNREVIEALKEKGIFQRKGSIYFIEEGPCGE